MKKTVAALEAAGARNRFTFPLQWGELIGEENVRPDLPPVHMIDTMDLLGFRLELAERPTEKEMDILYIDYN
jgi:hypothetical protein